MSEYYVDTRKEADNSEQVVGNGPNKKIMLRKRRPFIKNTSSSKMIGMNGGHKIKQTESRKEKRPSSTKALQTELILRKLLEEICETPENIQVHLDSVLEKLTTVLSIMDGISDTNQNIYMSDVGRLCYVIHRIVTSTYTGEKKSADIGEVCKKIMVVAASIIRKQVISIH